MKNRVVWSGPSSHTVKSHIKLKETHELLPQPCLSYIMFYSIQVKERNRTASDERRPLINVAP